MARGESVRQETTELRRISGINSNILIIRKHSNTAKNIAKHMKKYVYIKNRDADEHVSLVPLLSVFINQI